MEINIRTIRQTFTQQLFESLGYFFMAESKLSAVTILKDDGSRKNELNKCIELFKNSTSILKDMIDSLDEGIANLNSDSFIQGYCKKQVENIIPLYESIFNIKEALEKVPNGIKGGDLQVSLWHQGENAIIREEGVSFIKKMNEILSYHINAVEETNK